MKIWKKNGQPKTKKRKFNMGKRKKTSAKLLRTPVRLDSQSVKKERKKT